MSEQNFQGAELISTRIINDSLINFQYCKNIISPDKKFCIFYNQNNLIIIDLVLKKIISKISFNQNENISNVQILKPDILLYCKKTEYSEIVISSLNSLSGYYELKIKEDILNYHFTQIDESGINYMFVITSNYELIIFQENIEKKRIYIFNDINIPIKFKIEKMEYIKDNKILLIFTSNGLILNYSIQNDPQGIYQLIPTYNEYVSIDNNYNNKDYNYYTIINVNINCYICLNNENNLNDNNLSENEDNIINEGHHCVFVTITGIKKNQTSFISCYEIDDYQLIQKYYIEINEVIQDSFITKSVTKNSSFDKPNYIFLITKTNTGVIKFYYGDLFAIEKKKNNDNGQLLLLNQRDDLQNIFSISILNSTSSIKGINQFKIHILYMKLLNEYECFFKNEVISNYKNLENNYNLNLEEYILFYLKNRNNEEAMNNYKQGIINNFNNLLNRLNYENKNIDFFLISLISKNDIFQIKKYLTLRDPLQNNKFLVDNQSINETCKLFYNEINKMIQNLLSNNNQNNIDLNEFNDYEKYLKILIEIVKIVKRRNKNPLGEPFLKEDIIKKNDRKIIESELFFLENLYFIMKILNNYFRKNKIFNEQIYINNDYFNIFAFYIENENNYNIKDNFEYYLKHYFTFSKHFQNFIENDNSEQKIDFEILLYYTKFVLFNYYYYHLKYNNKENDINNPIFFSNFKGIRSEFTEYSPISEILFNLDNLIPNQNIIPLTNFLIKLNQKGIINKNNKLNSVLNLSDLNHNLLNLLFFRNQKEEAYLISNNISNYYNNFNDWNIHLRFLLEQKFDNLAYQFVKNCFALYYLNQDINDLNEIIKSPNYINAKKLYYTLFEYLITHEKIDVLFKLPLTFIEKSIFKEYLIENKQYEDLLIIYYLKLGLLNEAKKIFASYINSSNNNTYTYSKLLYKNLIDSFEKLYDKNKKQNENIDSIIDRIKNDENQLFMKVNIEKERNDLRNISNQMKNSSFIDNNVNNYKQSLINSAIRDEELIEGRKSNQNPNLKTNNLMNNIIESSRKTFGNINGYNINNNNNIIHNFEYSNNMNENYTNNNHYNRNEINNSFSGFSNDINDNNKYKNYYNNNMREDDLSSNNSIIDTTRKRK